MRPEGIGHLVRYIDNQINRYRKSRKINSNEPKTKVRERRKDYSKKELKNLPPIKYL